MHQAWKKGPELMPCLEKPAPMPPPWLCSSVGSSFTFVTVPDPNFDCVVKEVISEVAKSRTGKTDIFAIYQWYSADSQSSLGLCHWSCVSKHKNS